MSLSASSLPVCEDCAVVAVECFFYHRECRLCVDCLLLRVGAEDIVIPECLVVTLFLELPLDSDSGPVQRYLSTFFFDCYALLQMLVIIFFPLNKWSTSNYNLYIFSSTLFGGPYKFQLLSFHFQQIYL